MAVEMSSADLRDLSMTRWISLSVAIAFLGMFAAIGYGCQQIYEADAKKWHDCVDSGGTYLSNSQVGGPRCIKPGVNACAQ